MADPNAENALLLGIALRNAGAPPEQVDAVVRDTPLPGDDGDSARLAAWYATWRAVDRGDLPGALAELDRNAAVLPEYASILRGTRAHLTFLRDRVPGDDLAPDPECTTGRADSRTGEDLLTAVRAEVLTAQGLVDQARRMLDDHASADPTFSAQTRISAELSTVLAGDVEAGTQQAPDALHAAQESGMPGLVQAHAYVAVLGLSLAGRLGDGAQLLFRTLSSSLVAGFREVYHAGILTLGAEIASAQGRPEYARALAAQARAGESGTGPYPGMAPAAIADALASDDPAPLLWDLAADRLERGYVASAVLVAVEAAERGDDPARRALVTQAAAATEGRLLPALAAYVTAVGEGDADALATAAETFRGLGAGLYEVRALVSRALVLRRAGRAPEGTAVAAEAWRASAVAGYERSGLFARLAEDVALTDRELEIVRLLASSLSTADVARTLQMSVRTAETHLHNAGRKAGTSGRDALVQAVSTWLRTPGE